MFLMDWDGNKLNKYVYEYGESDGQKVEEEPMFIETIDWEPFLTLSASMYKDMEDLCTVGGKSRSP